MLWLLCSVFFQTYLFLTVFLNTFPSKYVICLIKYFRVDLILVSQKLGWRMSETWVRVLLWIEWGKTQRPEVWHRSSINICPLLYLCHMISSVPHCNTSNASPCLQYEGRTPKIIIRFSMVNVILCFWSLNFHILCDLIWNYSWTILIVLSVVTSLMHVPCLLN